MNIVIFEPLKRNRFLPLVFTEPFANLRIGLFTFKERWEKFLKQSCEILCPAYLEIPLTIKKGDDLCLYLNPTFIPDEQLIQSINQLSESEALCHDTDIIAVCTRQNFRFTSELYDYAFKAKKKYTGKIHKISFVWDLLTENINAIQADFKLLDPSKNQKNKILNLNFLIGENIYIEEGAKISPAYLNTETGPIYVGKNVQIMEGSCLRGPIALCENSEVKMGSKIYGATTLGPFSKVGGEVSHSILQGFSNKVHEGFLGSSLIGKWCNLAAGTNNSNLKNNYKNVEIFDFETQKQVSTNLQFFGLLMGEHSRTAIGTLFNTGTVTGIHTHIFSEGLQDKYIPSFSWGKTEYLFEKAMETAALVLQRRQMVLDEKMKKIYFHLHKHKTNTNFGTEFV